ncbi:MAG: dienelactone hydrolase family protein [Bacteroidota bacterium]
MKFSFLFLWIWIVAGFLSPEQQHKTDADITHCTTEFASLVENEAFRNAHALPVQIKTELLEGKKISWRTPDGQRGYGYEVNGEATSNKFVFVIHEWWGLNDNVKMEAQKIQEELGDVRVIALDLYDGQVATTREDAGKYMQSVKRERAEAIIKGAIEFVGEEAKIATIGWCFGGGWSLQTSILAGEQAAACVMYYGMPEKDLDRLGTIKTPVLGIFAKQDGWITPEVAEEFEGNMQKVGKEVDVHIFDAKHAFANPSSPAYNEPAAQEAWRLSSAFIKEGLM